MAIDIYLELEGKKTGKVKGETLSKEFVDHIEVSKVSFGATAPEDAATKQASGKMRLDDLEFETQLSSATSAMMSMLSNNETTKTCIFKYRKASSLGTTYMFLKVTLDKTRFTSISQKTEGEKQMITAKIGFAKMTFEYYKQKQDGSMEKAPYSVNYDGDFGGTAPG